MYLTLRILFTILSAICIAIAIPVGVWFNFTATVVCAALAFVFYLVMLTFKLKHKALNSSNPMEGEETSKNDEESSTQSEE